MGGPPWRSHGSKVVQGSMELVRGATNRGTFTLTRELPAPELPKDLTGYENALHLVIDVAGQGQVRVEDNGSGTRYLTVLGDPTLGKVKVVVPQAESLLAADFILAGPGTGLASIWGVSPVSEGDPGGTLELLWQFTVYARVAHP